MVNGYSTASNYVRAGFYMLTVYDNVLLYQEITVGTTVPNCSTMAAAAAKIRQYPASGLLLANDCIWKAILVFNSLFVTLCTFETPSPHVNFIQCEIKIRNNCHT